jgi:serine/threonine-protein kinase
MDINQRIGDYEILEELGRGGMGRVYRVRNVISDRVEAMKVLLPDLVSQADLESRFLREIKVLAALEHPNIATLRTAMKDGDRVVMIMEYVDGESLAQRVKRGAVPVAEAIVFVDQVLDALAYAHGRGVIHRDIKPANMMLALDGTLKLTDFGIARSQNDVTLTAAGTTTGSLAYMSPEQVNAEPTDARSDLYSVGISLYELVTGQRPFQADSDFAVMVAHLKEMPRPPIELAPALGPELNAVIMKAIAKSPADRYQTANDFRTALTTVPAFAALLDDETTPAAAPVPVPVPSQADTVVTANRVTATVAPITPDRVRTLMDAPSTAAAAVPPVPQPVMRKPANAVLYMAIGGVFAIAALVAAAFYINSAAPASAGTPATATAPAPTAPAAAAVPTAAPSAEPAPAGPTAPPASAAPATATAAPAATVTTPTPAAPDTASSLAATRGPARPLGPAAKRAIAAAGAAQRDAAAPNSGPAPPAVATQPTDPAFDFDALEEELDRLAARAVAINTSLDNLRREQARQGFGLRGDITARQQSMNTNLARAEEAARQRNATRAQRLKAQAESDAEALERFLGR